MKGLVDLHIHTTASDGTMSPREVVRYAKEKGISALAITDHDTVSGISEALSAGKEMDVEVIPGIEISVDLNIEMHLLGYFINKTPELEENLNEFKTKRNDRNKKIIKKLNELGFKIDLEEVLNVSGGEAVGRPHIASVLLRKGYVGSMSEAFELYLGAGGKAYAQREKVEPKEGIELILKAGGVPVLAHPKYLNLNNKKLDKLLVKLIEYGLAGMEVYYSTNTIYESGEYARLAIKHGLLITGGTDFHGKNKPEIEIGIGRGNMKIDYKIVKDLKEFKDRLGS